MPEAKMKEIAQGLRPRKLWQPRNILETKKVTGGNV
jgi:hypothetical protein